MTSLAPVLLIALAPSVAWAQAADPQAVQKLISSGDCQGALNQAEAAARATPTAALPYRLQGDALRCLGRTRDAVLAYRKAVAMGDASPDLASLVANLSGTLSQVEVRVTNVDWSAPPTFVLKGKEGDATPYQVSDGVVRFRDLQPGYSYFVNAEGPGYALTTAPVAPPSPGATVQMDLAVNFQGFGVLRLDPWPKGYTVKVRDSVHVIEGISPGDVKVTPGEVALTISGPTGERVAIDEVGRGEVLSMDPATLLPAQVNLANIPAGSNVSWNGPSPEFAGRVEVGWDGARTDATTGCMLQDHAIKGLAEGTYTYTLDNPWLGRFTGTFDGASGEVVTVQIPWQQAPGVPAVQQAWEQYKANPGTPVSDPGPHRGLAWASFGVAVVGLAGGGAALAGSLSATGEADDLTVSYEEKLAAGDAAGAASTFWDRHDAEIRGARNLGLAAAGGGVGIVGLAVGFLELRLARTSTTTKPAGTWDMRTLPTLNAAPKPPSAPATTGGAK